MKKLILPVILFAAILLLMSACSPKSEPMAVNAEETTPNALIVEGRVYPINVLDQSFSVGGEVLEVLVSEGEQVSAGQVLARLAASPDALATLARAQQEALAAQQALDTLNENAALALAQTQLALLDAADVVEAAQEDYDADPTDENLALLDEAVALLEKLEANQAALEAGSGVDPDLLAAAEARITAADAALASAQAYVDAFSLNASISGTISRVLVQPGQKVAASQTAFTVADFSDWVIKTDNLTELDVINVQIGQQVSIVLDALPDETILGEVTGINLFYEEKRGDITYTATIKLNQTVEQIRWGMTAAVSIAP